MHLREDDLELYVRGQLPADHTSDIKGHAAECSACSEKLAAMATFLRKMDDLAQRQADYSGAQDRRCELRTPASDPAVIRVVNPFSPEQLNVRVVDASKNGLKLAVPSFLQPGMSIQIRLENMIAFAEVRYCTKAGSEFHVGVQVQETMSTSKSSNGASAKDGVK